MLDAITHVRPVLTVHRNSDPLFYGSTVTVRTIFEQSPIADRTSRETYPGPGVCDDDDLVDAALDGRLLRIPRGRHVRDGAQR